MHLSQPLRCTLFRQEAWHWKPSESQSRRQSQRWDLLRYGAAFRRTAQCSLLMSITSSYFHDLTPLLSHLLTADRGYEIVNRNASRYGLRRMPRNGILYLCSHAGYGRLKNGSRVFCLGPFQPGASPDVTDADSAADQADLAHDRLCYIACRDVKQVSEREFAFYPAKCELGITDLFVIHYWQFADNSLVYIDGCGSDNEVFKNACLRKNASLYVGWTAEVNAVTYFKTASYLFDRLLGANEDLDKFAGFPTPKFGEIVVMPKEDPPQRPFDYEALRKDLEERNIDYSPGSAGRLRFTPGGGDLGLLAPSIHRLVPKEEKQELHIDGLFGKDHSRATVTINGMKLPIKEGGSETLIICDISSWNGGGDVVVEMYRHKSNTRRLTKGHVDIAYTFHRSRGTLTWGLKSKIDFRIDLQPLTYVPHQDVSYRDGVGEAIRNTSTTEIFANGAAPGGAAGTIVWSLNGEKVLPFKQGHGHQKRKWNAQVSVGPGSPLLKLSLTASAHDGILEKIGSHPPESRHWIYFNLATKPGFPHTEHGILLIPLDFDFTGKGMKVEYEEPGQDRHILEWSRVEVEGSTQPDVPPPR